MEIYIVTKSEARKNLLKNIGFRFRTAEVDFDEKILNDPVKTIKYNSLGKHGEASKIYDGIVVTFDTVIYHRDTVIGKPRNRDEARNILIKLSGETHKVYTGVVVGDRRKRYFGYGETEVKFIDIPKDLLEWYLDREEYWRYAAGYRIQGYASIFIEYVKGDFFNVIGVPIQILFNLLNRYGVNPLKYLD